VKTQTRTFRATDACGNTATVSQTVTWKSDTQAPGFTGSYSQVNLACNPAASDIEAALDGATATDNCGTPTVTTLSTSSITGDCVKTQTRTFRAIDGCGNTSTVSRTVTWKSDTQAPAFTNPPANVDLDCNSEIPEPASPTATDACGTPTVTLTGSTDNPAECSTGFNRIITRTWTAKDGCNNTSTYTQTIRVKCCEALCTYTQGYFGNEAGLSCNGEEGGFTTAEMIGLSLGNWGGTLTVGKPGKSVYVMNNAANIQCVIDKLPGGGPAKELPAGNFGICALPNSIKNILLAQTLTLGLNLGIQNPSLGNFPLQAGTLATQDPVGGCGDNTPKERICNYNPEWPYNLTSVTNEYTYRSFSPELIAAIPGTKNIWGLFELANRALANTDGVVGTENGVSISEIATAAGNINEVFDECKVFIGWDVAACPNTDPNAPARVAPNALVVTAYPNPYQENFALKVNSPVSGQALIGFYTIDGVKIGELKRDVVAKREVMIPYTVPAAYRTRIVYTVTVGTYNAKGIVLSPN
jgi:hypothetical protein